MHEEQKGMVDDVIELNKARKFLRVGTNTTSGLFRVRSVRRSIYKWVRP